jgi:surface polysaccharide O-acyltransferase-like enzyme
LARFDKIANARMARKQRCGGRRSELLASPPPTYLPTDNSPRLKGCTILSASLGTQNRIAGIDAARYIGIFGVILIHTFKASEVGFLDLGVVLNQISRFAVPVFFMIGGFFLARKKNLQPAEYSINLAKRILPAFLFWVLLYNIILFPGSTQEINAKFFVSMLATGGLGYHLWFLPAFCICMILTVFLRRFMRWRGIFATGCVLYVLGLAIGSYSGLISSLPEEHAGMRLAIARGGPFYGTIFVILGLWLGAGHWRIGMRSSVLLYLAGLVSSLTEAYLLATHHFMLFGNNDFLIGTLLMGFGAFSIALNLPNRGNIVRGIGRFGAYTMGIYAVHPIVLIALKSLLHPVGFFSNFYIAAIVLLVSTGFSVGISRISFARIIAI